MLKISYCGLILLLAAASLWAQPPVIPAVPDTSGPPDPARTVLIFLPQQMFADDEFEPVLHQVTKAGLRARIVTSDTVTAVSMTEVLVRPDLALRDANPSDFAGIVLIGGSGATLTWDDSLLQARCRAFAAAGKVVAAIGIAPITLARAGVLKNHVAAVFHDRAAIGFLKDGGARFSFRELVADRNVITAAGADQAHALGRAVAQAVLKRR